VDELPLPEQCRELLRREVDRDRVEQDPEPLLDPGLRDRRPQVRDGGGLGAREPCEVDARGAARDGELAPAAGGVEAAAVALGEGWQPELRDHAQAGGSGRLQADRPRPDAREAAVVDGRDRGRRGQRVAERRGAGEERDRAAQGGNQATTAAVGSPG